MLVIGIFIGAFIGVAIMCMLQINKEDESIKAKEYIEKLSKNEIKSILYCIDLITQYHGENEELEKIYDKLIKVKEGKTNETIN